MGKRKKIASPKFWVKTIAWTVLATSLISFGLGNKTLGAVLLVLAAMIAFIATDVSENADDFWHTDDGEELASNESNDETPND